MSLKQQEMKTIKNYLLLTLLLLFPYRGKAQQPPSSEIYNYNTLEAQKKWIVGTFVSDADSTWKLHFTGEGKCYWYLPDRSPWVFTYTIRYSTRKAETPSGYVNENIYTLYLKRVSADSGPGDPTYEMYVADDGLILYPMGHGGRFTFKRVKTQ